MTQPDHEFRVVLRGYEPSEVDRVVARPAGARRRGRGVRAAPSRAGWPRSASSSASARAEPPSFEHLGERVGQILALAEQEARELRDQASAEIEGDPQARRAGRDRGPGRRRPVRRTAPPRRRHRGDPVAGRRQAGRRRGARRRRTRLGRAVRQEAEALFEQQRADAAQAAADFETTLAERRERTAAEFRQQQAATQAQLDDDGATGRGGPRIAAPDRSRSPRRRTPAGSWSRPRSAPTRSSARHGPPPTGSAPTPTASSRRRPSAATASTPS